MIRNDSFNRKSLLIQYVPIIVANDKPPTPSRESGLAVTNEGDRSCFWKLPLSYDTHWPIRHLPLRKNNKTNFFMDTFTAIDFETAFASIFRFWLKPLSIMVCKSLNMKRIAPTVFIRRTFFRCARNTKSHSSTTKH